MYSHLYVQQQTDMTGSSRATACLAGIKQAISHNLHIETDMAACRATSFPAGIKQAITHNLQIEKDMVAGSSRAAACPAGIKPLPMAKTSTSTDANSYPTSTTKTDLSPGYTCNRIDTIDNKSRCTLPQQQTRHAPKKKSVAFTKTTRIYLVPTLDEYSEEEYIACWRGDREEKSSQDDLVATVQVARKHSSSIPPTSTDVMTTRGIEHLCSPHAMKRRTSRRKEYLDAVLDEQDRQWADDTDRTEKGRQAIRAIGMAQSKDSAELAIARAAEDAIFVKRMMYV
jgi:hypothetical protein